MDELVARIAAAAGIDADTAHKAVVAILGFLQKDGPKEEVGALMNAIPGATEAVPAPSGGGLMGMLGMGGGLMGLAGSLTGMGLGMDDMQNVGKELFTYAREKVGEDKMGTIVASVPGLSQFV